jgi:hypothetical protein
MWITKQRIEPGTISGSRRGRSGIFLARFGSGIIRRIPRFDG